MLLINISDIEFTICRYESIIIFPQSCILMTNFSRVFFSFFFFVIKTLSFYRERLDDSRV
jgi:hypothetical protein